MTPEITTATQHIRDILSLALLYSENESALVIFDTLSPLANTLTAAYKHALPNARFIDFNTVTPQDILAAFKTLSPSDLVVLIQSTNFRLNDFRVRVELFEQSLKVIEHPHLSRMNGIECTYYIDSLAYDPEYFHTLGHALKNKIDHAQSGIVDSHGERLIFDSPFESAKLNIGDYREMKNKGGQFPIGEVFTEAQKLESVNGRVRLFAFADTSFTVNKPEIPITLVIKQGRVIEAIDSTPEFDKVLEAIRRDENEVWVRELGFGMNRAFTPDRIVSDIGTYERMCGIHLSLGSKHGVYKKSNFKRGDTWHHVDVFPLTHEVYLDDEIIFQHGKWDLKGTH